jgi:RNA polymerase sigma-70 factor (ECF subfamily)
LKPSTSNIDNRQPDEELLKAFLRTGDLEILGILYQRYMHLVYGVCLRYFKDREEAMDGVMQIFEKLIVEIPAHKIQRFKSWLYVLTKNHCLMEIRSGKTRQRKMDSWAAEQDYSVEFQPELHPVDEESALQNALLKECIERLKNEQKECIELFFFQDKSYREIASLLAIEEKKVKSHLQNGKRNLKICLEEGNVKR